MGKRRILVWDLPTRVFHWLMVASFAGAFVTAESERYRDVHVALGYTVLGLVGFRLLWGLAGTRYARFSSFAFGPRRVLRYIASLLTHSPEHYVGHNPAGGWAIFALLAMALASAATGYASYEDIGGERLKELHEGISNTMLAIVAVHIAGVIASSFLHRENLARAMLDGMKQGAPEDGIRQRHRIVAILLLGAVAGLWAGGGCC